MKGMNIILSFTFKMRQDVIEVLMLSFWLPWALPTDVLGPLTLGTPCEKR